jgi:hypothetical protein
MIDFFNLSSGGKKGPKGGENQQHHTPWKWANANPIINHPPKPIISPSPLVQII